VAVSGTLARAVAVAALAGLLFGFDTAVIAGTTDDLRRVFALSPAALGVTVSAALWGTLAGALGAGRIGQRLGGRDALAIAGLLYVASSLGSALAPDWGLFVAARAVGGLGVGASSVLAPVYISEIAPARRRGALVGAFQLAIVSGILLAYLSNALIGGAALGEAASTAWRWKLGVAALPAAAFTALLRTIPQSPRWLVAQGRRAEAEAALRRLAPGGAERELAAIEAGLAEEATRGAGRLSWREHRRAILLAVAIAAFNQLAGINAILYYLNDIFAAAGYGRVSADQQAVAIGVTNLVFTAVAMTVIDRLGRKALLLTGAAGMAACLSLAAAALSGLAPASWLLWGLIAFIGFFAFSQGAVIWVYISEIFPTSVRAQGQSIGAGTHWLMNALISAAFPYVAARSKGGPFVVFAALMAVQFVVVWRFFPETKGVELEALQARLSPARRSVPPRR
jgi:sugar porter (SP) family MFS transporter